MNLNQKQRDALLNISEYEQAHDSKDFSLGWSWSDVRVAPATLNNLLLKGLIEEKYHSNSSRGLLLTDLGREQAKLLVEPTETYAKPQGKTLTLPDEMFEDVIGHDDIKELLTAVLLAEKPVHVLLAGPPALAKTMFLLELRRLPQSYYALAATLTAAGLADILFVYEPRFILIDEVERLAPEHIGVLNSLMATGIVSETKHGKTRELELNTRIFAAGIKVEKLPQDLLSRFTKLHFAAYTEQEFIEVSQRVLTARENTSMDNAEYIAGALWQTHGQNADVRQCVSIARLSRGDRQRIDEVLVALRKYGT